MKFLGKTEYFLNPSNFMLCRKLSSSKGALDKKHHYDIKDKCKSHLESMGSEEF